MSSFLSFTVTGESPYPDKSGIFEVQISITGSKPSSSEIENKSFKSIWKDNFHLNVRNGEFEETLGSQENPLPESITTFTKLWIVVTDQFSSEGSLFEFQVPESMITKPESKPKPVDKPKSPRRSGSVGPQGPPGDKGDKGVQGVQGDKGDKGVSGQKGPSLSLIHI